MDEQSKMGKLILLILFCHVSSAAKHSLKYFFTVSSGVPNLPELEVIAQVDDIMVGYCDPDTKIVEAKQDWVKKYLDDSPQQLEWYNAQCSYNQPNLLKATIFRLKQEFDQSGGVHVLQKINGCEWDDETDECIGFHQYGYDGEDILFLNLTTLTWIALKPQAVVIKLRWDADMPRINYNKDFLTRICPDWLKKSLDYGKSSLLRTERPSVSLLQKTPSSPVSCHATGFYPHRAVMFWRKDGEDLHEDVDQGEILPNHDGTFQMSVDLNLSSINPEDWRRYDCVFQLSGVEDDIVTKLDKAVIRTNEEKSIDMTITITVTVVVAALVALIAVTVFLVRRKNRCTAAGVDQQHVSDLKAPDNGAELSMRLNPET
ncbi:major histocompatibility complex class I-related gene protein-like [Seriola aureovittata]|uniref:major histocompatibility complex class I-related gene protein-like n=1 Tax=Seriola aureovittata TaxID=2871759 RepID=UPI0024BE108C|nr:major histocompatibility complex class I-related gene protein-like [Seriola aureovittata]